MLLLPNSAKVAQGEAGPCTEPKSVGCRLKWPLGHKLASPGTLSFHSAVCGVSRLVLWDLQGDMTEVMSELHLVFVLRTAWSSP